MVGSTPHAELDCRGMESFEFNDGDRVIVVRDSEQEADDGQ